MSFSENSIIYAVKGEKELERALGYGGSYVFFLKADINTVADEVARCRKAGKKSFIHIDLADGMGKDEAAIRFIAQTIRPDGILTTKINVVKLAKDYGMEVVYRVFMIDSQSMVTAVNNIKKYSPDAVEIMPGVAYDAIRELKNALSVDVIAGGLIHTEENVNNAFGAGAVAVSTSCEKLW